LNPPFLRASTLAEVPRVRHAFFTRRGGVSVGLYESLNTGYGSGDETSRVTENRRRAAAVFGLGESALITAYQIHSNIAVVADAAWGASRPRADAVVSRQPGLICGAMAADCAPVLIAEGDAGVVCAVHAGWRGALSGVIAAAVAAMAGLGARPSRMVAAIGPCIAQPSYEVGLEFLARFQAEDRGTGRFFAPGDSRSKRQFDLAAFVAARLAQSGVTQVESLRRDTASEEGEFFSNRRAQLRGEADYGRLLSAIAIDPPV